MLRNEIKKFKEETNKDPIYFKNDKIICVNLYQYIKQNESFDKEDATRLRQDSFELKKYNPIRIIFSKDEEKDIEKYINLKNFSINKKFEKYLKLRGYDSEIISITEKYNQTKIIATIIKSNDYFNYLKHLDMKNRINSKIVSIIRDRFGENKSERPSTKAILSNLGYLIKDNEGRYLELSNDDKTFFNSFLKNQIDTGIFNLKLYETLPMYKEGIQEIVDISKKLLKISVVKGSVVESFSKKHLGKTRKTLEGCWQLFFDKYLRVFLMGYKYFYGQAVFKKSDLYSSENRPDFLGIDLYNNIDIIEIKHHRTLLLNKEKSRNSYYPSHDLNKSIFQLNKYLDMYKELIDLSQIKDEYAKSIIEKGRVYRPRGVLIISSMNHITAAKDMDIKARYEIEVRKLKTSYNNIDVILFDELVNSLEEYLNFIQILVGVNHE